MPADPLFESIRPRTERLGRSLLHLASCASTMEEARQRAEKGEPEGLVVVSDEQTLGRGRGGRTWHSPRGALLATLLVRPRAHAASLSLIPLAAAVALARAIRRLTRAAAQVKWPNDVWIRDRKVAGVLADARTSQETVEWVLVGIGVNVDVRENAFPPELRPVATSLGIEAGRHVCAPALLKIWLEVFEGLLFEIETGRTSVVLDEASRLLMGLGATVRANTPEGPVQGTARRLGPLGELVVDTDRGERWLREAECEFVRPLHPSKSF